MEIHRFCSKTQHFQFVGFKKLIVAVEKINIKEDKIRMELSLDARQADSAQAHGFVSIHLQLIFNEG